VNNEQPSPSNERFSLISLVNVDNFHSNRRKMRTRIVASDKIILLIIIITIIDKCRICGTEGETIEHIISSCNVLAQSEYKKRHDIFAKIIHMNLAVKFNLLKNTQPHYSYTSESCLENDSYKLYFDRTILTDIHIKHNRPDIIILNKQQKQAYLLDIAVPNSHNNG
jgi:hypothetical protein